MCFSQTPRLGLSMTVLKCHTIKTKIRVILKPTYIKNKKTLNVGLEPGTRVYRVERSTTETINGGVQNNLQGGLIMFHPRKNAFHTNGNSKTGTRKKSHEGSSSKDDGNLSLPGDPSFGTEHAVPERALSHVPRSPNLTAAPLLSPGPRRAAMWGGRAWSRSHGGSGGGWESRCPAGHTKTE